MEKHARMWLEAFKFLKPQELLLIEEVSRDWQKWSSSDEVWSLFIREKGSFPGNFKGMCRKYLPNPAFIACFRYLKVTIVDIRTLKETTRELESPFYPSSYEAWVSLPKGILYCGGLARRSNVRQYVSTSFLIDISTFEVEKLPNMRMTRAGGGLIYHKGTVYVFGGDNENKQGKDFGDLRECEKFILTERTWVDLPDMSSPRRSFTPAIWKEIVYIAGGGGAAAQVELFDTNSDTFRPSPFAISFTDRLSTCFILREELIVISEEELLAYEIPTGRLLSTTQIDRTNWYSAGGTVTYQGEVYFGAYYWPDVFKIGSDLSIVHVDMN